MKVLITGATGFIGMHILNAIIKSEHDILSMGLKEKSLENYKDSFNWIYGDITNLNLFKEQIVSFNPDAVIHLAWKGIPDYSEKISWDNLHNSKNFLSFILNETNSKWWRV